MPSANRMASLVLLALAASLPPVAPARADVISSYKIVDLGYVYSNPQIDSSIPDIDESGNLVGPDGRNQNTGIYQLGSVQDTAPGMQNVTLSYYLHDDGSDTNLLPTSLQDATQSAPTGLNSSGLVIGVSSGQPYIFSAVTGQFVDVQGILGQTQPPFLSAINNAGQIVGNNNLPIFYSTPTSVPIPLTDLLPANSGWMLLSASDINDLGEIVGTGVNPSGQLTDFELIPTTVPEPTALMVLGLGTLLYGGWRSRTRAVRPQAQADRISG